MGKSVSNFKMMKLHVDATCATGYANQAIVTDKFKCNAKASLQQTYLF